MSTPRDQPVEQARAPALGHRLCIAVRLARIDHVDARLPARQHLRNDGQRVLEVGIDQQDAVGVAGIQPGLQRCLLAEVA
jgi:hypothetical protein